MTMYCSDCFEDDFLVELISNKGVSGKCGFCEQEKQHCLDVGELKIHFENLINIYKPIIGFEPGELLKERELGDYLWEKIQEDWEIFRVDDYEKIKIFFEEILTFDLSPKEYMNELLLYSWVEDPDDYWGDYLESEDLINKEWQSFSNEIKYVNRFFLKPDLLEDIKFGLKYFENHISEETIFFRARVDNGLLKEEGFGMPPKIKAVGGRGNPVGIPYFYLASDRKTAFNEIKKNQTDAVVVTEFKGKKDLIVIDLRNPRIGSPFKYKEKLRKMLHTFPLLNMLGNDLSRPIDYGHDIEYLPTQYLCELIKQEGFDGILYKSSKSDGYNLMFFADEDFIELKNSRTIINRKNYLKIFTRLIFRLFSKNL